MRIPTWRFMLIGAAIALLAGAGIGLVAASPAPASAPQTVFAAGTARPDSSAKPDRPIARERLERARWGAGRLLGFARHLVHGEVTVTDADGALITLAFDHGTVQSTGGGSLVIAEAGGATETVSTDDATIVHVGRADGSLNDLSVGDEVFVQSRVDGGTTLAKRVVIIPAAASE